LVFRTRIEQQEFEMNIAPLATAQVSGLAIPSEDELVARAAGMVPILRTRAEEIETARGVPADVIQMFQDAGFFRILQPRVHGGYEMNPLVFMRVLMELGRGCCSSAWNMMILGVHNWEFGLMDPRAGQDVWGQDNSTMVASSYVPVGQLSEVEGGFRLKGRWPTSSGSDHGKWAFLGAVRRNAAGAPIDRFALLVNRDDYSLIDDWNTFGLCGTGSKSLVVVDAFIPSYRAHSVIHYDPPQGPAIYRLPFNTVFFAAVSAVIIGFTRGAIDVFIEQMKVRTNLGNGDAAYLSPYVKDRLGNAVARVRAARARLEQMMEKEFKVVEAGGEIPLGRRIEYTSDMARVGRECEEAVLTLYKCTSARGVYKTNPIQRYLRDILVAANHITQDADNSAGNLGGYLLTGAVPPLLYAKPATA
jgi:3-hydroxy-9,10-secoandrosta-1,3,5(10)-triene-9,17-dione monooxygenase